MVAIFNNCPACLAPTAIAEDQRKSVLDVYNNCWICKWWHRGLFVTAIAGAILASTFVIGASVRSETALAVNSAGVVLTIVGGYLLFGKLELLLLVGRTLGGFHEPGHMALLAAVTRRTRIGLFFVIVGLTVQAWS